VSTDDGTSEPPPEAHRPDGLSGRSIHEKAVDRVAVELVLFQAVRMKVAILERVLHAIDLVADLVGLSNQIGRLRGDHAKAVIESLKERFLGGVPNNRRKSGHISIVPVEILHFIEQLHDPILRSELYFLY